MHVSGLQEGSGASVVADYDFYILMKRTKTNNSHHAFG